MHQTTIIPRVLVDKGMQDLHHQQYSPPNKHGT